MLRNLFISELSVHWYPVNWGSLKKFSTNSGFRSRIYHWIPQQTEYGVDGAYCCPSFLLISSTYMYLLSQWSYCWLVQRYRCGGQSKGWQICLQLEDYALQTLIAQAVVVVFFGTNAALAAITSSSLFGRLKWDKGRGQGLNCNAQMIRSRDGNLWFNTNGCWVQFEV